MLTEKYGTNVVSTNFSREEIPIIVSEKFGMPEQIIIEALESIIEIKDIYY